MQVFNLPINDVDFILQLFWQLNFADWFGIIVGGAGLGLAVAIFAMQFRTEKRIIRLQNDQIFRSYVRVYYACLLSFVRIRDMIREVENPPAFEANIQTLDRWRQVHRYEFAEHIDVLRNESEFLRDYVSGEFHTKISTASVMLQRLMDYEQGQYMSPSEYAPYWIEIGKQTNHMLDDIQAILKKIKEEYEKTGLMKRV